MHLFKLLICPYGKHRLMLLSAKTTRLPFEQNFRCTFSGSVNKSGSTYHVITRGWLAGWDILNNFHGVGNDFCLFLPEMSLFTKFSKATFLPFFPLSWISRPAEDLSLSSVWSISEYNFRIFFSSTSSSRNTDIPDYCSLHFFTRAKSMKIIHPTTQKK